MVRGPDGDPYVLDRATKAVYRIDLKTKAATLVVQAGTKTKSGDGRRRRASWRVGGQDLLILDAKNVAVALAPGRRRRARARSPEVTRPGRGLAGATTSWASTRSCGTGTRGLYNLYIVDPSEQQIRAYTPAADGSGFPAKPTDLAGDAHATSRR